MGAEKEVLVTLSGGAPWGFRLQGGAEQRKPLQVSKIRRRSQAGRAGLRERDQLLAINGVSCASLSHASAMSLIDASGTQLVLTVQRVEDEGPVRSPSPGELQVLSPLSPMSPEPPGAPVPQPLQPGSLLSPPDSEAYYGETDSDADGAATQEKPRRPRRRGPTRPTPPGAPPDEVYLSDSPAEPAPATSGPSNQGDSRVSSPSSESGATLKPSPGEALLLPHGTLRPGPHLIPMVGPVSHPVAEDLTTTYAQKAKQAKLQRAESLQEKSVKEAKTKCRTIASLLTAAPNPHSKGVLMFKKRRQRAKKYTLVSFGSAAGTGAQEEEEEEDGVPPTSESELDEEAFSDARSLTNQSDWDSPYLDMELARPGPDPGPGGQLSEAAGRGVRLFEQQRQRAASSAREPAGDGPAAALNGGTPQSPPRAPQSPPRAQSAPPEAAGLPQSGLPPSPGPFAGPRPFPAGGGAPAPSPSIFNRSARPFTPGFQAQRPGTSSVIFRPVAPKRASESLGGLSPAPPPFLASPPGPAPLPSFTPGVPSFTPGVPSFTPGVPSHLPASSSPGAPRSAGPVTATSSLYIPAPNRPVTPGGTPEPPAPSGAAAMTSTASIFLSAPLRPGPAAPGPAAPGPPAPGPAAPEPPSAREQRISVPAARTGILQEARRRGTRKQMFRPGNEETKNSPNPELLSLVQNLDEKPRAGGAESGPEEDALSLGAEACNFMQPPGGRSYKTPPHGTPKTPPPVAPKTPPPVAPKTPPPVAPKTPPPVAPKPSSRGFPEGLVNGAAAPPAGIPEPPRLQGRGGELFAKRQSRADRYVVEATPSPGLGLGPRPRSPSPTPSLPPSWKYSPNIRAPPPIAYNPLLSPYFPQAARTLPSKAQSQGPRATPKQGIKALDFMRHQPYQLKTAMFCFDEAPQTPGPTSSGPPKTARVQEVRRFSTPAPQPTAEPLAPTVLAPRAATTLDEPIWRAELASVPVLSPAPPPPESPRGLGTSPSSCGFQVARPRFSATKTGLQAQVWRPGAGHH
ncbi:synaptopodin 2-like protein isoform X1 [Pipistrellus kuhlii]|uniref:Synaptopodin 2-like protein n=1 Tax=Pipistrellus kuhlii TaxID=59472 RepID=A0A7J7VCM8_PIPKU|nr:synaptopodin 2-like protein isoform X1 [Pipistrellus kuhlii]KAF6322923.1 synaptopodin 2 like [Pipistrellus kuhlii]